MAQESSAFETALAKVVVREIPGCKRLISAERLSGGASQETYRLLVETEGGEKPLALRRGLGGATGRSASSGADRTTPGLATEALLMRCAREAGVPEPEVYYVLEPEDGLGEGFVMEWLEGEALGARIVRSPELAELRPRLAFECGQVLARIHGIDLAATGLDERLESMSAEQFVRQTWERYQLLPTEQPMIDFTGRWLIEHLPRTPRRTLVHNDFRNGNFMVGPNGIVAVLDWEIAHIGDPMRDLGWICTNSWRYGKSELPVGGFGEIEDLLRGYESVSGELVDPAELHYWQVFGSFWWAVGCLGMAAHYRIGPDKSVERAAIGRRTSECQVDCVNLLIPGPVELVEARDLATTSQDMPRLDELVEGTRDFLRGDVMASTDGRTNFLARVAANGLDVVLRELTLGEPHRAAELVRLRRLLDSEEDLPTLRRRLARGLRGGSIPLDLPGLAEHLRSTVVNQIRIDQPKYSGLKTALAGGVAGSG